MRNFRNKVTSLWVLAFYGVLGCLPRAEAASIPPTLFYSARLLNADSSVYVTDGTTPLNIHFEIGNFGNASDTTNAGETVYFAKVFSHTTEEGRVDSGENGNIALLINLSQNDALDNRYSGLYGAGAIVTSSSLDNLLNQENLEVRIALYDDSLTIRREMPASKLVPIMYAHRAGIADIAKEAMSVNASSMTGRIAVANLPAQIPWDIIDWQTGSGTILMERIPGNIPGSKLADGSISASKLSGTIDASKLASGAVTSDKIFGSAITSDKIFDGAISPADIAANSITAGQLANDSVETAEIKDGAVTTAKIADSNVTTAKIADSNVTTAKIADSNVTTAKIADSNVTTGKIADLNVTTGKIAANAITVAKLDLAVPATDCSGSGSGEIMYVERATQKIKCTKCLTATEVIHWDVNGDPVCAKPTAYYQ